MGVSNTIIKWYHGHSRSLPWRDTKSPYSIWVSEIILQQTRVEQGLDYYLRFLNTFPGVKSLSQAEEDQVLKLWQGLGYYSRARNMMFAAKQIMSEYDGHFPDKYEEIIKLKGVGPYTAAAISSFAFDLPYAVVDGNVYRVLARYYGIETAINTTKGQKLFAGMAQEILDLKDPAIHNQAIMEFGALHCKSSNPLCNICPLSGSCIAFSSNKISVLPKKEKKLKVSNRYLHFLLITKNEKILIEKRDYSGIWKGLYQLPLIETGHKESVENIIESDKFNAIIKNKKFHLVSTQEIIHKLTHRNLHIRFYRVDLEELPEEIYSLITYKDLHNFPFPKPIEKYLEEWLPL